LSMLKFLVNELDIASLRQKFESIEYFIPKSEKFFLGKDRNNVELWFEEV
ncbi:CppA C-terminal domain-containing protein, partial [Streptococcus pneumoniae]